MLFLVLFLSFFLIKKKKRRGKKKNGVGVLCLLLLFHRALRVCRDGRESRWCSQA